MIRKTWMVGALSAMLGGSLAFAQMGNQRYQDPMTAGRARANQQPQQDRAARSGVTTERQQRQTFDQQGRQDQALDQQKTIRGTITSFRTLNLDQEPDRHVIAKVQNQQGKTFVVNLGPVRDLQRQNVQLNQGQAITVRGRAGRINGRPVLIAHRFQTQGQSFQSDLAQRSSQFQMGQQQRFDRQQQRSGRQDQRFDRQQQRMSRRQQSFDQRQRFQQQGQSSQVIQGRLLETDVQDQNVPQNRRVARIRTQDGRTYLVDLGRREQTQNLRLQRGEWIGVIGDIRQFNGQQVILADSVADVENIDRRRPDAQPWRQNIGQFRQQQQQRNQQ